MFINRNALANLDQWLTSSIRKPLVIRGARQVGKTALVRHFAASKKLHLIEINFERRPELRMAFQINDPKIILSSLESILNQTFDLSNSLMFLDEIQIYPELLAKLRWFAEEMPELPVISAGSLLEFVLEDHTFSMPVGRINYLHLEPLSFEEYLGAIGETQCLEWLMQYHWGDFLPDPLHEKYLKLVKQYSLIGGMPAAVASWITSNSLAQTHQVHDELLATYYDDFSKYAGRIPVLRLQEVLTAVPKTLGEKCIYSHINPDISSAQTKLALDLLAKARLIHRVYHTDGNGIPLGAQIKEKKFKMLFLDIGLAGSTLDLNFNTFNPEHNLETVNRGGISEQFVGQTLRTLKSYYVEPRLYYWLREEKGSNAEIDYLIQHQQTVVPIEVKAGSTGSLKSLHLFMSLRKLDLAVRICSDLPSQTPVDVKLYDGTSVAYRLLTLPFYLTGQLHRLIQEAEVIQHR
ncbi:MAG: ATP-binding protein [Gammaproteobacteria bacterium]